MGEEKELFEEKEGRDEFGVLEARVVELLERYRRAKEERDEISRINAELKRELIKQEEEMKRLKDALEEVKKSRELVYAKVKGLIEKLEAIG